MTTNSPNPVDGDVQELISDAEAIIELFESAGATNQIAYKLAKIAHASLTAEPGIFEWRFKDIEGTLPSPWIALGMDKLEQCRNTFGDMADYRFWFPKPPAQLLRPVELPNEAPNALLALCQQVYDSRIKGASVAQDVWQDCLDELFQQTSEVKS